MQYASLAYVHLGTDDFTASGPTAALTTLGSDQYVGYSTLGVWARVPGRRHAGDAAGLGYFAPSALLSPEPATSSGIPFANSGVPLAHNNALIEAGLDLASGDAMLGLSYSEPARWRPSRRAGPPHLTVPKRLRGSLAS